VYNNTLATVKRQIQLAENPTPAAVISTEAWHVDNAILRDNLTSAVAFEEPAIGSTDSNILIDSNCTDDELHFGMSGGCKDYDDEGNKNRQERCYPHRQPAMMGRNLPREV
jgi:hypothetical protein